MNAKTKLNEYKAPEGQTEDDIVNALELEKKDLTPDPEAIVATGDEDSPVTGPAHSTGMKSLYDKARKNRELVQRDDAEGTPDVALLQRLNAEASGGEKPETEIDTNKPDRFAADRGEETIEDYNARLIAEDEERQAELGTDVPSKAANPLPPVVDDAIVEVTILGRTLSVPQQDIDDAGGVSAYQKNRAATIKLQQAATLLDEAQQTSRVIEPEPDGVQLDDPSTDGLSDADTIESLNEEMMDVVAEGSQDDINAWIAAKLKPKAPPVQKQPTSKRSQEPQPVKTQTQVQKELQTQFEADRVDANDMMVNDFPDIMADPTLLGLAQQRFNVIKTNPNNEGRSQTEMAREAANHVRKWDQQHRQGPPRPVDPAEAERQQRIVKKRSLPQQSRADRAAPSGLPAKKTVPTRKEHFQRLRRMGGHDLPPE